MEENKLRQLAGRVLPPEAAARAVPALMRARKNPAGMSGQSLIDQGISYVTILDPAYPERLRQIPDPPLVLYYRGRLPENARPSAAVIGTREASPYGREEARRFAGRLAACGVQVISGMARGIDGIAGRAALENGRSFAVLGGGVDIVYPRENRDLYERLIERGGVLSEYAPGTEVRPRLFPPRNRIISGLSDIVLVVEARKKSGTMITVDMALEQGREVFAVPGRNTDVTSEGCNGLIEQGCGIAMTPSILLDALGISGTAPPSRTDPDRKEDTAGKELSLEQAICRTLSPVDLMTPDDILPLVRKSAGGKVSEAVLRAALFNLQLKGLAAEEGTGFFRRVL